MNSIITLIVAIAFTLGSLFAFSSMDASDADEGASTRTSQKSEKASSERALLHYDFEFFSH